MGIFDIFNNKSKKVNSKKINLAKEEPTYIEDKVLKMQNNKLAELIANWNQTAKTNTPTKINDDTFSK